MICPPIETPGFLKRAFSHLGTPSSKRVITGVSSGVLCIVFIAIGRSCAKWILYHGDLGAGAMGALVFSGGLVATLAGIAYRKPDGVSAPPAPGGTQRIVPSAVEESTDGGKL